MNFVNYLFNRAPGQNFSYYIHMIVAVVLIFAAGLVFSEIYRRKKGHDFAFKRLFKKTAGRFTLFGLLFLVLVLMRYENIPYFSMRLWLYLSILWFLYFLYRTIRTWKADYPRERENVSTNRIVKEEQKYTPGKWKR